MPRHIAKRHKLAKHGRPVAHGKPPRARKPLRTKKPVTPEQPGAGAPEPRVVGLLEIDMVGGPEMPEFEEESAFISPLPEDSFALEEGD